MASRYRSLSKPTLSLLKSTITKPKLSKPTPLLCTPGSSPTLPRSFSQIRCLQSMLPLHTAVSSARLTSCLGIDSSSSRSLSQGVLICGQNIFVVCVASPTDMHWQFFECPFREDLFCNFLCNRTRSERAPIRDRSHKKRVLVL